LQINDPAIDHLIRLGQQLLISLVMAQRFFAPTHVQIVENPEIPVTGRMKWPDCEGLLVLLLRPSKVAGFALEDAELVVGIQIISVGGDSLSKRLGSFFRFTGSLVNQPQIEERSRQA